jgi:hypothetical protein
MADQDTDEYIFEVNAIDLRRKLRDLQDQVQWTDLMYVHLLEQFVMFSDKLPVVPGYYRSSTNEAGRGKRLKPR